MKKITLLISGLFLMTCVSPIQAQENSETTVTVCSDFHITKTLMEINADHPVDLKKINREHKRELKGQITESKDHKHRDPQHFEYSVEKDGAAYGTDPSLIQTEDGSRGTSQMRLNIAGQNATAFRPNDPSGAAGPNHYVQMINSTTYKIYNKTTGAVFTTGTLGNLWASPTPNDGDPIVMYDRFADRWFLAQFGSSGNKIYIAISTTNDPTGSYYTYTFTSAQFPDYLKFSIWQDGYYMTSNQSSQKVFAFERTAMLAGNAASRSISKTFSPPNGGGFFCPLPGDADGNGGLPPAGTPCPIFTYSDNGWGGANIDAIQIYAMAVNWVPVTPTATLTFVSAEATNSFDGSYNSSWLDIAQPGTTQKLDGIGGVLNYRAQWRKWSTYNSVVLTWGVKISATQRSIMWCELRQDIALGTWSVYQQGVFTPDTYSRWLGSIAMDDLGNIALCYAKSGSSTVYPSLGYTGRLAADPINTMTFAETIAATGTGSQTGVERIGDYSQTSLDPNGNTFWHTGEYMGGSTGGSAARTRIYSFQLSTPTDAGVSIVSNDADNVICTGASITFTATPTNGGAGPTYQWLVNGSAVGTGSTYTTTTLTTGQVVTCVMTSNMAGVTANPATSNALTITVSPYVTPAVTISGNTTMCSGVFATYTASASNSGSTPTYQWQVNGVNAGTNSANYSFAPTNGQVVTCIMTSNATCVSPATANSNTLTITVNATPATPTISNSAGTLTSSAATGNQWYFNGAVIPGATSVSYTPTANGLYSVVSTVNGCASASSSSYTIAGLGIDEMDPYVFAIYPNPSQGDFNISFNASATEKYTLKVYDEAGRLVYNTTIENQNDKYVHEVHLGKVASGNYNITLSNGTVETSRKIIVKN